MKPTSSLRISHFYEWAFVNDKMVDCVLAEFAANGAQALSMAAVWSERILGSPAFAAQLGQKLSAHQLVIHDAHAPWGALWDLDLEDPPQRPRMLAAHRLCMAMLADFGVKTYAMHIGAAPNYSNGGIHTDVMRACSYQTLEALLPTAEALDMIIAVENIVEPSNTPDVVLDCIQRLNSPYIACCLDMGHAHVMDADATRSISQIQPYIRERAWNNKVVLKPFSETVKMLAPWIVTCHIHDNDATGDDHRLPGDGTIDWKSYMAELRQCPRLQSLQNEWHPSSYGYSIDKACRIFEQLVSYI